jgi:hypothetical protein
LVLAWEAYTLIASASGATVTAAGFAGVLAPLFAGIVGLLVLSRPDHADILGLVGVGLVVADVVGMLVAPAPVSHPHLVFTALLLAGVGGVLCLSWRPETPSVTVGRFQPAFRASRGLVVVALVVLLAVTAAGAASGDKVPAQEGKDTLGGLVLDQGTLEAAYISYQANCPKPKDPLIDLGPDEPCLDITVDSTTMGPGSFNRTARLQLDSARDGKVEINDFIIFKNFYDSEEDSYEYVELSASYAVAETPSKHQPYAVEAYFSEYRAEAAKARLDLVDIPLIEDPGIKVDKVDYWTCTPQNESGFGTINDIRLGIDSDPRLTGGSDGTILAHQLESTKTTLTNFKVETGEGRRERPEADLEPTTPPGNCL